MANFVELSGGTIIPSSALSGGVLDQNAALDGGAIQIAGGGGGGGSNLTTKTVSYTPTESAQSDTQNPPTGYDGFSQFTVNVGAISSTYVGTGITRRTSSDLSASGATVTAPSGYYASSASKTIANASAPYLSDAEVQNDGTIYVEAEIDDAGYMSSGTYALSKSGAVSVLGATTYTPTTSDQTIASGQYLTGAQTIKGDADLVAGNIKKDVNIFGVTGTYEGGGGSGLPAEYQEVEYVGNANTAKIVTEDYTSQITSTSDLVIECEMSLTTSPSSTGMFVAMSSWAGCWLGATSAGVITVGSNQNFTNLTATARNSYVISFEDNYTINVTAGGTTKSRNGAGAGAHAEDLTFFGIPTSTSYICKARLYGHTRVFKSVHNGDNYLIAEFVPCYHISTGSIGLYDLVGTTFYTTQSGDLEKGDDIITGAEALAVLLGG